jgi:hypothetical protein
MTLVGDSVYNSALNQLTLNEHQVPSFVPPVCLFIREFSNCIGIFRQCGQHLLLQDLGIIFCHSSVAMPPCASVYDAAAFLKKWLRELPTPLVTPAVVNEFFNVANPDSVRAVLQHLSQTARRTLAYLCKMIESVVSNCDVNQMTFKNLAFCLFENITQGCKNLDSPFPFMFFYENAILLIDDTGTDFVLDNPILPDRAVVFDDEAFPPSVNLESIQASIVAGSED